MKSWFIVILMMLMMMGIAIAEQGLSKMNFTAIDDAKIESNNPDLNRGNVQLRVGVSGPDKYRTYLKFDISQIPKTSIVQDAKVHLKKFGGVGSGNLDTYRVLDNSWDEDFITWNNAPTSFSNILSSKFINSEFTFKELDVKSGLEGSLAEEENYFSLMLRNSNESPSTNYHLFQNKEQSVDGPVLGVSFFSNKPKITNVDAVQNANEGDLITIGFNVFDEDNNIITYKIFFDGHLISNSSSATHQINYEDSGIKEIRFFVEDATGLTAEVISQININNVDNLRINEILPIPLGNNEWIELFNPTDSDKNVDNCEIRDGFGNVVLLKGYVEAKSFGVAYNVGKGLYGNNLLNDYGDMARLFCDNVLVDEVTYGSWDDGNLDDNAVIPSTGLSLGRKSDGEDTNIDKDDFIVFNQPTPEETNNAMSCEEADQNCDSCISLIELLNYIERWKADSNDATLMELLHAIDLWKSAEGC